ncbi:MAG: cell filamentation protein Fic [Acidobacteria bacterium]|nr:MAG: cell filamentation protein Fic [Acidobacteriota bacterium]
MDLDRFSDTPFGRARRTPGRHGYVAYFPRPIPRSVEISPENLLRLADAEAAVGRLVGAARLLPQPHLLVRPYLRREAVASTRIEGTQASLVDVFDAEAGDRPLSADVEEVVNYVRAMETGIRRLETLPVSTRLVRELHAVILAGVRGREHRPGEIRSTQNWIGPADATIETATFVPPPPDELGDLLTDLERFVHEEPLLSPLVQAALVHYQFETIHPFLDGNGRLGRLLIVFLLIVRDRLPEPLLYLSPYLEARRDAYYGALQGVRERGDLDEWLALFLDGVRTQATDAVARAERLIDLRESYRAQVRKVTRGVANAVVDLAFEQPVLNARLVVTRLSVTRPAALASLRRLVDAGVLTEVGAGPRGELRWHAEGILKVLAYE